MCQFVVTGLKQDLNTKLKMLHSPKNHKSASLEMEMRSELRAIFMKHVYPIVQNEFGWLIDPLNSWLENNIALLNSYFVSGVTASKLFWPRSHIDHDVWFTVLVCLDYRRGIICGGDFGFGSVVRVLQCKHGDVIVYNPLNLICILMNQSLADFFCIFHEKECTPCRPVVTGYGKQVGCAANHTSLN